jgi:NitT/TauT family transport system substrate-binding protein
MIAHLVKVALPALLAALSIVFAAPVHAQDKVLKVGTLKLIHGISAYFYEKFVPAGYTVEVFPFESPTDGKNAVLTGTVDTCIHGIAAFLLGAAAGEPVLIVANANNRGMAVISGASTGIKTIKDLRGKRVAIWPGSTQEAVILERLRMEGMSIRDIQPIAFRSAITRRRSHAAMSTPMWALSPRPASASPTAPDNLSSIPIPRRSARST